jgi:hypothetical protein
MVRLELMEQKDGKLYFFIYFEQSNRIFHNGKEAAFSDQAD